MTSHFKRCFKPLFQLGLVFGLAVSLSVGGELRVQAKEVQNISFSDDLVARLRRNQPEQALILECEKLLGLPAQALSDESDSDEPEDFREQGFLNLLEANLDQSPETEILLLIGRREENLTLAVLKQQQGKWNLAGQVQVGTWYYAPELGLFAGGGPSRSFYVRQLEERGTGIFKESYEYYKLIDGKLVRVLRLPIEARLYGWGQALNQHLHVRIQPLAGADDRIVVTYLYRFFAGADYLDLGEDSDEELVFLEGQASLDYLWDAKSQRYLPDFYPDHPLNQIKLESLETYGAPELFVRAFSTEIEARLKQLPPEVAKRLKALLEAVPD